MQLKASLSVAAGAAAIGFIGYCIYFDHKRRSDPTFKQKLRERRRKEKETKKKYGGSQFQIPDLSDPEKINQFFVQEIHLGEELIATGDIENGIDHLAAAAVICGEPQQLLGLFSRNLPPQVFQRLTQRIPAISEKLAMSMSAQAHAPKTMAMMEEDLE